MAESLRDATLKQLGLPSTSSTKPQRLVIARATAPRDLDDSARAALARDLAVGAQELLAHLDAPVDGYVDLKITSSDDDEESLSPDEAPGAVGEDECSYRMMLTVAVDG